MSTRRSRLHLPQAAPAAASELVYRTAAPITLAVRVPGAAEQPWFAIFLSDDGAQALGPIAQQQKPGPALIFSFLEAVAHLSIANHPRTRSRDPATRHATKAPPSMKRVASEQHLSTQQWGQVVVVAGIGTVLEW